MGRDFFLVQNVKINRQLLVMIVGMQNWVEIVKKV